MMIPAALIAATSKLVAAFNRLINKGEPKRLSLVIPLNPVPASRPRVSKWGVYYTKKYATWKKQALIHLPQGAPIFTGPVVVSTVHVVQKPKTTKRTFPNGDVDNYMKATLDALTACEAVWNDDDQVQVALGTKRFTQPDEEPRTEVTIVEM